MNEELLIKLLSENTFLLLLLLGVERMDSPIEFSFESIHFVFSFYVNFQDKLDHDFSIGQ